MKEQTTEPTIPPMPWSIEWHQVGEPPRPRAFKVLNGVKLYATTEDVSVWEHVQALTAAVTKPAAKIK